MEKKQVNFRTHPNVAQAIKDLSNIRGITDSYFITHHLIKAIKRDPNYKELGYSIDIEL